MTRGSILGPIIYLEVIEWIDRSRDIHCLHSRSRDQETRRDNMRLSDTIPPL